MIRDEEIKRLVKYAEGMGLKVYFEPYTRRSRDAAVYFFGSEIIIYQRKNDSKLETIFSLIHEISHHKAYVDNNRCIDPRAYNQMDTEEDKKADRKRIYEMERDDSVYWEDIYRDTNCSFNIQKLYKQKEYDLWVYEFYYENGRFPNTAERKDKKRKLKKKYKC